MSGVESSGRADHVARAAKLWTSQLIDLSGRNRLLHYRTLKVGTLELTDASEEPDSDQLTRLRSGAAMRLSQLFPFEPAREAAAKKLRSISAKAIENEEERGISTLYLAWGMATWTVTARQGPVPNAPVFLLPLTLDRRSTAGDDFDIQVEGDIQVNPTLVHYLDSQLGTKVDTDLVLEAAGADEGLLQDPEAGLKALAESCREITGFTVSPKALIGNFSFAKLPMVLDLEQNSQALIDHELIAALAGDPGAQADLRSRFAEIDVGRPNHTPPDQEFLILDADSSQNHAINRILGGESLVVQGPPGTGKSQTIANVIAASIAAGEKVLFVAEKRAAIDAVMGRLEGQGLSDLVLDLHSRSSSRQEIVRALGASMDSAGAIAEPRLEDLHANLTTSRSALVAHAESLHRPREPWGISLSEVITELAGVPASLRTELRMAPASLRRVDRGRLRELTNDLREYVTVGTEDDAPGPGSWVGAPFLGAEMCQSALDAVNETLAAWNELLPAVERACAELAIPQPTTWAGLRTLLELIEGIIDLTRYLSPGALADHQLEQVYHGLKSGTGWLSRRRDPYKDARARALALAAPNVDDVSALTRAIKEAVELQHRWNSTYGPVHSARLPSNSVRLLAQGDRIANATVELGQRLPSDAFTQDLDTSFLRLRQLRDSSATLFRQPRLRAIESDFTDAGLDAVLREVSERDLEAEAATYLLRHVWLQSVYELESPQDFSSFSSALMDDRVEIFQRSDREHLATTPQRVSRAAAIHAVRARDDHPDQSQLLANQVRRKRGILPVRELFRRAPDVMLGLKPCWTMSPLLVAQMLPGDRQYFDLVVFDEASQVTPADAISAILRAPQVVVAGDTRQLPPTTFFATETTADLDDEEGLEDDALDLSVTTGFESVLDAVSALVRPAYLDWHYRSRDERLIAFSNTHIYDGRLTTFPGTQHASSLSQVLADPAAPGSEVHTVTGLVLDHARNRPDQSLGVIAMGIKHADLLTEAIRSAVAASPDRAALDSFFSETAEERFFVKNLERVQGDERDAIILTTGYQPGPDGRMRYSFGPLNQEGGERRLNVAITRARSQMTLVSSFRSDDLDPARTGARGADLLRRYLRYMETSGGDLALDGVEPVVLNPFEIEVRDALASQGIPVFPQFGVSGYRLDFAAAHPEKPGRMVLAIECDGASYHSSPTARDRDRLRQSVLENLGWRFHRIWSTDWFRDRGASTARVVEAWNEAVRISDHAEHEVPPPQRPEEPSTSQPTSNEESIPEASRPTRSGPKPTSPGRAIDAYRPSELEALIRWIRSDTLLRTKEELLQEAMAELGFRRRGHKIVAALEDAIDRTA